LLLGLALGGCAGAEIERPGPVAPPPPAVLYAQQLPAIDGGTIDLADYRGRVLLLDFFATWAQPSVVAIRNYSVLQAKYAADGLAVVGVALDELGREVVAGFAAGMQIPYPVALASAEIRSGESPFGPLEAVPTLMVFDRRGRLVRIFVGLNPIERIERLVRRLL
jgi:peroxiredoxin